MSRHGLCANLSTYPVKLASVHDVHTACIRMFTHLFRYRMKFPSYMPHAHTKHTLVKPIGYTRCYLACIIGHLFPI
jgi:hypothetical protein